MGGTQIRSPVGGGVSPSGVASGGRLCRATLGKASKRSSNAFPQGGPLDQGDRPDALGGAGGVEAQHLLVPESSEVLPYRCGVVQGVGLGRCGGWWCGL